MRVVLTGASGFIGKNLRIALGEHQSIEVLALGHEEDDATVKARLAQADVVIHPRRTSTRTRAAGPAPCASVTSRNDSHWRTCFSTCSR